MSASAQIGVYGLGPMGRGLALNFADKGIAVAAYDPWEAARSGFRDRPAGLILAKDAAALVASLARPRAVLIMVKAGAPTDAAIEALAPLLDAGDVLIDGGNAFWRDTERRARALTLRGLGFLGLGVSGGREGARHGPALMAGGDRAAYERVAPLLRAIAARTVDEVPCCAWAGPGGAGHFVKMVHNGIEYAEMQAIAEAHLILRHGLSLEIAEVQAVFARWGRGPLASYLIDITADILGQSDPSTGEPLLEVIRDRTGEKGTGGWAAQAALELGVPAPTLAAAVFARHLSRRRWDRLEWAVADTMAPTGPARGSVIDTLESALKAVRLATLAQGMSLIDVAAASERWPLDVQSVITAWRAGCIIRSRTIDHMARDPGDPDSDGLGRDWQSLDIAAQPLRPSLRAIVMMAQGLSIPVPAFSTALAYADGLRAPALGANLIAAQRDYFGAHGYERIDGEGLVHTDWSGGRE